MTEILTLDAALRVIADRSFYEDVIVVPVTRADTGDVVGYVVEDDISHATDDWTWTHADGIADRDSVSETTRLMGAAEIFTTADHIRHHMQEGVEALEDGRAVTFAYAVVSDADVTWNDEGTECFDPDGHPADDLAGWILVSIIHN